MVRLWLVTSTVLRTHYHPWPRVQPVNRPIPLPRELPVQVRNRDWSLDLAGHAEH